MKDSVEGLFNYQDLDSQEGQQGNSIDWLQVAEDAIYDPSFAEINPTLQQKLIRVLDNTIFYETSSTELLVEALTESPAGTNVFMIASDKLLDDLQKTLEGLSGRHVDGTFVLSANRKVGVVCLRDVVDISPIYQKALLVHEFTHANDFLYDYYLFNHAASLDTETIPGEREAYLQALLEISAYKAESIVLDNETNGQYSGYQEEMYLRAREEIARRGLKWLHFPRVDNFPEFSGLKHAKLVATCSTFDRLHYEKLIKTETLISALRQRQIIG